MTDQLIPTLAMAQDPRLRRLFALVGLCLEAEDLINEGDVHDVLFTLAPEYVPPQENEYYDEWRQMAEEDAR